MTTTLYVCVYVRSRVCLTDRNCGNPTPGVRSVGVTGGCGQDVWCVLLWYMFVCAVGEVA